MKLVPELKPLFTTKREASFRFAERPEPESLVISNGPKRSVLKRSDLRKPLRGLVSGVLKAFGRSLRGSLSGPYLAGRTLGGEGGGVRGLTPRDSQPPLKVGEKEVNMDKSKLIGAKKGRSRAVLPSMRPSPSKPYKTECWVCHLLHRQDFPW